jgi:hypothetical protein
MTGYSAYLYVAIHLLMINTTGDLETENSTTSLLLEQMNDHKILGNEENVQSQNNNEDSPDIANDLEHQAVYIEQEKSSNEKVNLSDSAEHDSEPSSIKDCDSALSENTNQVNEQNQQNAETCEILEPKGSNDTSENESITESENPENLANIKEKIPEFEAVHDTSENPETSPLKDSQATHIESYVQINVTKELNEEFKMDQAKDKNTNEEPIIKAEAVKVNESRDLKSNETIGIQEKAIVDPEVEETLKDMISQVVVSYEKEIKVNTGKNGTDNQQLLEERATENEIILELAPSLSSKGEKYDLQADLAAEKSEIAHENLTLQNTMEGALKQNINVISVDSDEVDLVTTITKIGDAAESDNKKTADSFKTEKQMLSATAIVSDQAVESKIPSDINIQAEIQGQHNETGHIKTMNDCVPSEDKISDGTFTKAHYIIESGAGPDVHCEKKEERNLNIQKNTENNDVLFAGVIAATAAVFVLAGYFLKTKPRI